MRRDFQRKHQMLGIQMYVPGSECIRVLRAASSDPFSMAATPIADLLRSRGRAIWDIACGCGER
jgi:hypothetical protein